MFSADDEEDDDYLESFFDGILGDDDGKIISKPPGDFK